MLEKNISQPAALAEDGKMHRNGDIGEKKEKELALAADKIPDVEEVAANTRTTSKSGTKIEGLPKKSYASLLKFWKENTAPSSSHDLQNP
ncbi:hypothetical protein Tsubulata_040442, partial [Turnera subulata]